MDDSGRRHAWGISKPVTGMGTVWSTDRKYPGSQNHRESRTVVSREGVGHREELAFDRNRVSVGARKSSGGGWQ